MRALGASRTSLVPGGVLAGPWVRNDLWRRARAVPSLDLRFADNKSLTDAVTGASLVTFTRSSIGTYTDSAGVLQTAATDVPRFDHNPTTGESLGLLVEEQRTNLLLRSEEFDNASWSNAATPTAVTPNTQLSPSGLTTADTLANTDNTNNEYRLVQFIASASQLTFSVFIKKGTHRFVQFRTNNVSSGFVNFDLDLNSAFATTAAGSVVDAGAGWKRCIAVFPAQSIASVQIQLVSSLAAARGEIWTPTGTISVYVWGAQLEAGASPTSYIKNVDTAAGVTRNADLASITGSAFSGWYRQDEGTVFADSRIGGGAPRIWDINDGGDNNRHNLRFLAGQYQGLVVTDSASQVAIFDNTGLNLLTAKNAYAYQANDFNIRCNGGTFANANSSDASGTVPTVNRLFVGQAWNGGFINGHIRRLTYWPTRLGNNILQGITQ